jgi:hypothetical protein
MHSVRLQEALEQFVHDAGQALHEEVLTGAEVPFELDSQSGRRGASGPALYCYRPLTGEFIAERQPLLERLPSHAEAARLLGGYAGLDRYLAGAGVDLGRARSGSRARAAIRTLLGEVFAEQSDFELRPERLLAALERLEQAGQAGAGGVMLVATLHGLTIASAEVPLTKGLTIAHPDALEGLPEGALAAGEGQPGGHLVALLAAEEEDPRRALDHGREVLKDLLRALRLFGDGRVTLGALAWARIGTGVWNPLALGSGGRPRGMLIVTAEQEDELRAFCSLVSRRAPDGNALAWALRRFELGCERESPYEGLSDHLLALRALLEPEGPASGMLPGRLAALCATPEQRLALTERAVQSIALERAVIEGAAVEHAGGEALANDLADHLRALLRDVICGHLDPDLDVLADEILLEQPEDAQEPDLLAPSVEDVFGYAGESQEVLDLSV